MAYVGRLLARASRSLIPRQIKMPFSSSSSTDVTVKPEEEEPIVAGHKNSVPYTYVQAELLLSDPSDYVVPDPGYTGTESDALLFPLTASTLGDKFDPLYLAYCDPHFGKVHVKSHPRPNTLGESVGSMRFELLAYMLGDDDPFEHMSRPIRPNATREDPHLLPVDYRHQLRQYGCICNHENNYVHWMKLKRNVPTRCRCGHWFKLVQYEIYEKHVENYRIAQWHKIKDEPDWIHYMEEREKAKKEMLKIISKIEDVEQYSYEDMVLHDDLLDVEKKILALRDEIEAKYFPEYKQCLH